MAKILIIDDSQDLCDMMESLLERLGHETLLSHDAEEGWAAILREAPDLVVLDIKLPGENGDDLCRRMHAAWPGMPILIFSSTAHDGNRADLMACGATAVVTKGEPIGLVVQWIESCLSEPALPGRGIC